MKIIYFIIFLLLFSCNLNNIEEVHGISNLKSKLKDIKVTITNKNDVIKVVGPPLIKEYYDKNIWVYFENRKKTNLWGKKVLILNDVIILKFNKIEVLEDYLSLNINDIKDIKFDLSETESPIKISAIETILTSTKKRWEMSRDRANKN